MNLVLLAAQVGQGWDALLVILAIFGWSALMLLLVHLARRLWPGRTAGAPAARRRSVKPRRPLGGRR